MTFAKKIKNVSWKVLFDMIYSVVGAYERLVIVAHYYLMNNSNRRKKVYFGGKIVQHSDL